MKKVFILSGEPSGDKLASTIISKLQKNYSDIEYLSVGGSNLKKIGIKSIFELKFFFSSSIKNDYGKDYSSKSIKEKIKKIISHENKKKPLSDNQIKNIKELHKESIPLYQNEEKIKKFADLAYNVTIKVGNPSSIILNELKPYLKK